jgi:hypothetical protein
MDERVRMGIHIVRMIAAIFPYLCFGKKSIASRTLSGIRMYCWNVRTDASRSSSKLLNIGEGPDGKFSSSRWMMLWTVGHPDGISRSPNRCCLIDERPDGIPRCSDGIPCRPDGCKGSDYTVLKSVQNLLETYLWRRLLKTNWTPDQKRHCLCYWLMSVYAFHWAVRTINSRADFYWAVDFAESSWSPKIPSWCLLHWSCHNKAFSISEK